MVFPRKRARVGICGVACIAIVNGCAGGDAPVTGMAVRDSAGVRVVEHAELPSEATTALRVAREPRLRIGAAPDVAAGVPLPPGGGAAALLYRVRGATKLSSGVIVVANGSTSQLLFFSQEGELVRSAGRTGQGPGEFRDLRSLARGPGDTLIAHDLFRARATVFDSAGTLVDTYSLDYASVDGSLRNSLFLVSALSGGSLLARVAMSEPEQWGTRRDPLRLLRYERASNTWTALAATRYLEVHRQPSPTGGIRANELPFGRTGNMRSGGGRVVVWDSETFEVRLYSEEDGRLEMVLRALTPLPTIDADAVHASFRDQVIAKTWPAFADVRLDSEARIWIERYERAPSERTFDVFARDGVYLGTTKIPLNLQIMEIGGDYLLGVERDALDVEYLVDYPIAGP